MKGSTDPGRHRCEAILLQMNDAKADLEYEEVIRKDDKEEVLSAVAFWLNTRKGPISFLNNKQSIIHKI